MQFPPLRVIPRLAMPNRVSKIFAVLVFVTASGWTTIASDTPFAIRSTRQDTEWIVTYKQQRLLVYAFDPLRFKPCARELAPLGGPNILRDAPADHLHHHALMFAVAVNGVNFWEEISGSGV